MFVEVTQTEIWKDVLGYEGIYRVSDRGKVKSLSRVVNTYNGGRVTKERFMASNDNGRGYKYVDLSSDGMDILAN